MRLLSGTGSSLVLQALNSLLAENCSGQLPGPRRPSQPSRLSEMSRQSQVWPQSSGLFIMPHPGARSSYIPISIWLHLAQFRDDLFTKALRSCSRSSGILLAEGLYLLSLAPLLQTTDTVSSRSFSQVFFAVIFKTLLTTSQKQEN